MNKKILVVLTICLVFGSCAKTPESIRSGKKTVDNESVGKEFYVNVQNSFDDMDDAYKSDYSKFTLPEKSSVKFSVPQQIYNLELEYVTKDKTDDWFIQRLPELSVVFDNATGGEIVTGNGYPKMIDDKDNVVEINEGTYSCLNINRIDLNLYDSIEPIYINRFEKSDTRIKSGCEKAQDYAKQIKTIVDDDLDTTVYDVTLFNIENDYFYTVDLQKSYEGVGIMNMLQSYAPMPDKDEQGIVSVLFQSYANFTSSGANYTYHGSPSFKVVKADPIDKVLSFKGACDILENELAEGIDVRFDDVELLYEPYGYMWYGTQNDYSNVVCTPKWYFIIDNKEDILQHTVECITIDCVSGEIEVFMA